MKKIYKTVIASTGDPESISDALNKLAEEEFFTIENVTPVNDNNLFIIVSKIELDTYNSFTLTNNLVNNNITPTISWDETNDEEK